jgi:lysozyme
VITDALINQIARHEGLRTKPYLDTEGVWTIGYGHNLNEPITDADARHILLSDIQKAIDGCVHAFPWFLELSQPRQDAMIDLAYNMGIARLSGFKKFLAAMALGNYDEASYHLLDSRWAAQVKGRSVEVANMIRGSEQV